MFINYGMLMYGVLILGAFMIVPMKHSGIGVSFGILSRAIPKQFRCLARDFWDPEML